ncbi:MAG: NADH-quinone oxidoreductase subunit NuoE [Bacteroidales bacterium]
MKTIAKIIENYPFARRENLIPILQDIQDEYGYLTEDAIKELGKFLDVPTSKIYSLATFYSKFRFHPAGTYHLKLCRGISCHLKGSTNILNAIEQKLGIQDGESTPDGLFSLEVVACMGACAFGPVLKINENYYTEMDEDRLDEIIEYYKEYEE